MTMINKYLQLAKTYKDKYGDNTILLMQVGSFYEMYAKKNKDNYTNIIAFKNITDYIISEKQPGILMAGGPDSQIDRLIQKVTNNGFTVIVYSQDKYDKKHRTLAGIYSPGTNFKYEERKLTNKDRKSVV